MITLKKVGVEFSEELVQLWKQTFIEAYSDKHSPENINTYIKREYTVKAAEQFLTADDIECIVAFDGKDAVGFYVLKYHNCPVESSLTDGVELKQIYVMSNQFGKGVGKQLLNDAYQTSQDKCKKNMWLVVVDINERARNFYLKQNFKEIGTGPVLKIGTDHITSKYMIRDL